MLTKIEQKAEIECGRTKMDSLKKTQGEEKAIYVGKECGKLQK